MNNTISYEDLNLFTFNEIEKTVEWCFFHIEGAYLDDDEMCDTYDTYTFSFDTLIELAEDFDEETFLIDLMDNSSECIYTEDDCEFDEYEELFKHSNLLYGSSEEIKDYLLNKIKEICKNENKT